MIYQRLRDDAKSATAIVEHRVGNNAHQAELAAAVNEVDLALDHQQRKLARRGGEGGVRAGRIAAINRKPFDGHSWISAFRSTIGRAP
jgi:hypothetical protein